MQKKVSKVQAGNDLLTFISYFNQTPYNCDLPGHELPLLDIASIQSPAVSLFFPPAMVQKKIKNYAVFKSVMRATTYNIEAVNSQWPYSGDMTKIRNTVIMQVDRRNVVMPFSAVKKALNPLLLDSSDCSHCLLFYRHFSTLQEWVTEL